ncbi:hypothetical protein [Salmonella enterica]|uniref:hypothetical protein n=1 Tax=Salmonella enterica TaxID=28901 RepID=UPI00344B1180
MRLEQMREAPSRVRYTWEQDDKGNPFPHGWHTPPGKDSAASFLILSYTQPKHTNIGGPSLTTSHFN